MEHDLEERLRQKKRTLTVRVEDTQRGPEVNIQREANTKELREGHAIV